MTIKIIIYGYLIILEKMIIDEPIIQRVLLEQFRQVFTDEKRAERILELQTELERLNRESH